MVVIRCPECQHAWKTDRGKISHRYQGSHPDLIRAVREAAEAAEYEVPLPMTVVDPDAPEWLAELGVQGHLGEVVSELSKGMEMDE